MANEVLLVCTWVSVPFICLYLFYTFVLISLPDYKASGRLKLTTRLHSAVRTEDFYFVFLLPCLNEEKVIKKTLEAILSLPFRKILTVVIDDGSDDGTSDVVKSMNDSRIRLHQRVLPDARRGKGAALNSCYTKLNRAVTRLGINPDQVIVAVIDGDGRPDTNILSEAVGAFANPRVGAAQARVRITNQSKILPLMQDLEFAVTVGAMQNAREYFGCVGLGGNGQFTRLSALRTLGASPWTSCLLEDFDLGLRILLHGWETRFLSETFVAQQGLTSLRKFIRQRSRWVQGNMQCLRYTKSIWQAKMQREAKWDLFYFLAQPWLNMLGTVLQIADAAALVRLLHSPSYEHWLFIGPFVWSVRVFAWMLLTLTPGFLWVSVYRKRFFQAQVKTLFLAGLVFPLYNLLVLPSVWLAFLRHVKRKNHWVKTERLTEPNTI
ncbi:glycosyltransferase [Alicyclobacillus tolerans]|uniref:glycosyltransferase n=1 Tax=Alicyclobacillus tolerans TaxID=90970 RepID=UPI001F409D0C|nr:glycosyltransferase family 2 protein [Alicyclobacillus tolerans]MCF8565079.1 glycosyltransferase [Alicyclobacillus tolerans]